MLVVPHLLLKGVHTILYTKNLDEFTGHMKSFFELSQITENPTGSNI